MVALRERRPMCETVEWWLASLARALGKNTNVLYEACKFENDSCKVRATRALQQCKRRCDEDFKQLFRGRLAEGRAPTCAMLLRAIRNTLFATMPPAVGRILTSSAACSRFGARL